MDNDVNIMAMAEYEAENTHNDGNFLFVKLGTGIGCGIFCGGKIYRGASGCAGDIGHISIEEMMICVPAATEDVWKILPEVLPFKRGSSGWLRMENRIFSLPA